MKPCLIVFSHQRWGVVHQRPQQLMSRLARDWRVLFFEEPRLDAAGPARLECSAAGPQLSVLCPVTPVPAVGFHDDQMPVLTQLLRQYLQQQGIEPDVAWLYTPMALPLLAGLRPRSVVYDCMDGPAAARGGPPQWCERERALLRLACLVFAGGPTLYEAKRALMAPTSATPQRPAALHCLCSAVDAQHFAPARLRADHPQAQAAAALQSGIRRPRLGYFGVVDERVDLLLLARLADAQPQWQLVMVGPVARVDPAALPRRPNIHWLGQQPYERLPYLAADWDLGLMPFALNEATRWFSPAQALEYMAAEKPVVSTPVADVVMLYGHVVRIARGADEFIGACAELLRERGNARAARLGDMLTTVSCFSWETSARTVARFLGAELARPRGSVGVPVDVAVGTGAARPAAGPVEEGVACGRGVGMGVPWVRGVASLPAG